MLTLGNTTFAPMPIPAQFSCVGVNSLPFGGAEILIIACLFLFLMVMICVTFIDVAFKQMWPSQLLDPAVVQRVAKIQQDFPELGEQKGKDGINYSRVVSQEPYISGRSVDEDLIYILANNNAFGTVSSYCSSTVRGYNALSALLLTAGMVISFLWVHNCMINPRVGSWARVLSEVGYILVFLTGFVMTGPNGHSVYRNANIALWSNIPTSSSLLKLHDIGIVGFCLVPMLTHSYELITEGSSMPNYHGQLYGVVAQLVGAVCFVGPPLLQKAGKIDGVMSNKLAILGEIVAVFSSFITYVQIEFYATAVCSGYYETFNAAIYASMFGPLTIFVARHYKNAPTSFVTSPSVMLMTSGIPVAMSGPMPILAFDQADDTLPVIPPAATKCEA